MVNADRTVTDMRSKLIWQRELPSSYAGCSAPPSGEFGCTWTEAQKYCQSLSLAGKQWRLPTRAELESLTDDTRRVPTLDPSIFPHPTETDYPDFWTASPDIQFDTEAWLITAFGTTAIALTDRHFLVRCVSSGPGTEVMRGAASSRYANPEAGVVRDERTKLTWQREANLMLYTQAEAIDFCTQLQLGAGRWRLPSRAELATLVDLSKHDPALARDVFADAGSWKEEGEAAWTSTRFEEAAGEPARGWTVWFSVGQFGPMDIAKRARARCVQ